MGIVLALAHCRMYLPVEKGGKPMIRLRNAGTAFILTLFLALALCTTSAFAQSAQMKKSASIHAAIVVHQRMGGAPLSAYPFAPTVPFAPAVRAVPAPHAVHFAPVVRAVPAPRAVHFAPVMRAVPAPHAVHFAPAVRAMPAHHALYVIHHGFHALHVIHYGFHALHVIHYGFHALHVVHHGFHALHVVHHGFYHMHSAALHHTHTAARAVAVARFFGYYSPCDDFLNAGWNFWWFPVHPWLP
jgi:hypothetical protein